MDLLNVKNGGNAQHVTKSSELINGRKTTSAENIYVPPVTNTWWTIIYVIWEQRHPENFIPKFIFFDFECSQDEKVECEKGYQPLRKENCKESQSQQVCKSCCKCQHCKTSWCGKATHCPNFVVAHSVCPYCTNKHWPQNLYVESAVPAVKIVTIPVCGTTKTKVLVQANAGFKKSLSNARIF